jgi:hypothetical protein
MTPHKVKREQIADTTDDVLTALVVKLRSLFPACFAGGGNVDSIGQSEESRAIHRPEPGAARAAHHRP